MSSQLIRIGATAPDKSSGDVVFVHGLGGSSGGTWRSGKGGLWPAWIAADRSDLCVWTYGYENAKFGGGGLGIEEQAVQALDVFRTEGIGRRPTVLIGHSRGGLLLKQMLVLADEAKDHGEFVGGVRGIVFLATPHRGSALASIARWIPGASKATRELYRDNPMLVGLHGQYVGWAAESRVAMRCFIEGRRSGMTKVVDDRSADLGMDGHLCVIDDESNHAEITKPKNQTNRVYRSVLQFLSDVYVWQPLGGQLEVHPPLSVHRTSPYLIRVSPSPQVTDLDDPTTRPHFVSRPKEHQSVVEVLDRRGSVLLAGPTKTGKSRVGYEILAETYPDHTLVAPKDQCDLDALIAVVPTDRPVVVWLDDLDRFINITVRHISQLLGHLDTDHDLKGRPGRRLRLVVATIRDEKLQELQATASDISRQLTDAIGGLETVVIQPLDPPSMSPQQQRETTEHYPDVALDGGLAAGIVAETELIRRVDSATLHQQALVWALADWHTAGQATIAYDCLTELYPAYVHDLSRSVSAPRDLDDSLDWAQHQLYHRVSCTVQPAPAAYRLTFDFLTDHIRRRADRHIKHHVWDVIRNCADSDHNSAGFSAARTGNIDVARQLWRTAAANGNPGAMFNLGVLEDEAGNTDEARRWWRRAADDHDHPDATDRPEALA